MANYDELRQEHYTITGKRCIGCDEQWPCSVMRLLDENEALEVALDSIVDHHEVETKALREALNQRGHVAEFREDGYALEHPIECRTAGLIDCPVNRACEREQVAPALGRFYVSVDEDGNLLLGDAP